MSQVYEASQKGQKIAVKVRHPNIEKNIEIDVSLVFAVSRFFSFFSKMF